MTPATGRSLIERSGLGSIKATPEKFELVGTNQLGDEAFATPVIVDSKIYLRVAERKDAKRQEVLYCVE